MDAAVISQAAPVVLEPKPMKVDNSNIRTFHPAKVFTESTMQICGMDFHVDGKALVISSLDDSLTIYNCETGAKSKSVNSKKYGVGKIRFDKDETSVLHTSTKVDHTVRYLSLSENKYVRYFLGHTKEVMCLEISTVYQGFASSSRDKTARIWDFRLNNCQGLVHFNNETVVAFDPEGLIFAAACAEEESVKLFDLRNFDKGPFAEIEVQNPVEGSQWHEIKFSPDGSLILVNSNSNYALAFESLETGAVQILSGIENETNAPIGGVFTPCGKYALVGSGHGSKKMSIYEINKDRISNGSPGTASSFTTNSFDDLPTHNHIGAISTIAFNPKYMLAAAASQVLEFWIPDVFE